MPRRRNKRRSRKSRKNQNKTKSKRINESISNKDKIISLHSISPRFDISIHENFFLSTICPELSKFDRLLNSTVVKLPDYQNQFKNNICGIFGHVVDNTFLSFQHIRTNHDFDINIYCKDIVNALNRTLNGKWIIEGNKNNESPFDSNRMYQMPNVKLCEIDGQVFKSSFTMMYKFDDLKTKIVNKYDIRSQVHVSYGYWGGYDDTFYKCIMIVFIHCEYAVQTHLPFDYRTISNIELPPYFDSNWCLYYNFNDRDRWSDITPRMAYKLFISGLNLISSLDDDVFNDNWEYVGFPECCKPYLKVEFWQKSYIEAIKRVLLRLINGMNFEPNCTAEEMAVHMIFDRVYDEDESEQFYDRDYFILPDYGKKDKEYEEARERVVEDEDVLMLFDKKLVKGLINHQSHFYWMMNVVNLHPSTWFLSFRDKRFCMEYIKCAVNEGTIWTKFVQKFKYKFLDQNAFENITRIRIKYKVFIQDIWNIFNKEDIISPDFSGFSYSIISVALNRNKNNNTINIKTLYELSNIINGLRNNYKSVSKSKLIAILMVFYRLQCTKYFECLSKDHDVFQHVFKDYYFHLLHDSNRLELLHFYSIIISLMAKTIYHDNYSYNDTLIENQYAMNCLDKVSFENVDINQCKLNDNKDSSKIAFYLRAPITCFVNRRIGTKNYRNVFKVYHGIMNHMNCFNKKCDRKSSNKLRFKMCSDCFVARYCSKHCQKIDWKLTHKKECKLLQFEKC